MLLEKTNIHEFDHKFKKKVETFKKIV